MSANKRTVKTSKAPVKQAYLGSSFYKEHKHGRERSDFGLDNSTELIGGGFGLYSTTDMRATIGPIKTDFFRIAITRKGKAKVNLGLETFNLQRNTIVMGFPDQIFSLYDQADDFFAYYMLFKEGFLPDGHLLKSKGKGFPFYSYTGVQSFVLSEDEGLELEQLIFKVNSEIKSKQADLVRVIQIYIQLMLVLANRSYERQGLAKRETDAGSNALFTRFVKLVGRHFLKLRKVADYAELLHVTADHLNRTIKTQSNKTAHEWIDEMILIEAKAHLLQTTLSISEIAYQLGFTDPSHFNKFFKKLANCTPLQYRSKSQ